MSRAIGSKLSTFIGEARDPNELICRLIKAELLMENVNDGEVLGIIREAFMEEGYDYSHEVSGEHRAHMVLDHRLQPYLSAKGIKLMRSDEEINLSRTK
jgi:hypothetical protein